MTRPTERKANGRQLNDMLKKMGAELGTPKSDSIVDKSYCAGFKNAIDTVTNLLPDADQETYRQGYVSGVRNTILVIVALGLIVEVVKVLI